VAQYKAVYGASVLFGSRIMSCSQEGSFRNLIAKLPEELFSVEKVNTDNKHHPCNKTAGRSGKIINIGEYNM